MANERERTVKIRLTRPVCGDFPFIRFTVAYPGIYDAQMNPHGALTVTCADGFLLGIKPGEFEFVDEIPEQWRDSRVQKDGGER